MPSVVLSPGRFLLETAGTTDRAEMIWSALRPLTLGTFLVLAASPAVSTMKRSSDVFSAMTPLNYSQYRLLRCQGYHFLPLNDFFVEIFETLLHVGHIDILPPRFLALSRGLAVLLRGIGVTRLASEDGHVWRLAGNVVICRLQRWGRSTTVSLLRETSLLDD